MYSRLVIFPLLVMVTGLTVRVWAQDKPSANEPQPPSLENLPRLLPPQPFPPPPENVPNPHLLPSGSLPNVPTDVIVPEKPPVGSLPSDPSASPALPPIAGIPYAKVQEIVDRHREELMRVPGVYGVTVGKKGFLIGVSVYTNDQGEKPKTLPAEIQALPKTIEGLELEIIPLYVLPPPPGVIVLRAGGIREEADTCPKDFEEQKEFYSGWRFCVDPQHPQDIPQMWVPPIAGIPHEECLKILERHREELLQLPGVGSVGLGLEGIIVEADDPSVVPTSVEGLPIKVGPRIPKGFMNHTTTSPVQFAHGGIATRHILRPATPTNAGTLTGVVLSKGQPWLVFPTHLLSILQPKFTLSASDISFE